MAGRCVAEQVAFCKQTLKPDFHLIGSRVVTRRLSSYGSTGFNLYSPTDGAELLDDVERDEEEEVRPDEGVFRGCVLAPSVAVQVDFVKANS
jgi:hypothetical protein